MKLSCDALLRERIELFNGMYGLDEHYLCPYSDHVIFRGVSSTLPTIGQEIPAYYVPVFLYVIHTYFHITGHWLIGS